MSAYATSIPGASVYGGAALLAKTAYQKSLARINQQRGTTIRQAGFTSQIDPTTGMVKGLAVDPNNMYGDFQMLNRNQAQQDESARWEAQSRGLGTGGGLAAQLRNQTRFNFGKQDSDLATGLQGQLANYTDQQTQAKQDQDAALYQAELAAAQAAQQNGDWSPTDYSGLPDTPYGMTPEDTPGGSGAGANGGKSGGSGKTVAQLQLAAKTRRKSVAAVKGGKLGQYGWGAAGTLAKGTPKIPIPDRAPPKKPKKQYLPGQAPTSLAVINNKRKK